MFQHSKSAKTTTGRECTRSRRAKGFLPALAVLPLLMAACIGSTTTSTTTTVSIPSGWKTYTYGKMAIAVPSTWVVEHDTNCVDTAAPGALLLGFSISSQCPASPRPGSYVAVLQFNPETYPFSLPPPGKPVIINGIPAWGGLPSPESGGWIVPSLRVQMSGSGPDSNRAIHTLHRA
jgi:hypothetical protein